ncbi:hypothetical protein ERJ75_001579000 [Trypanosoma vivax]|nr:hypothetical protein ERJ75_001579000 [Trypanosoma vivax]
MDNARGWSGMSSFTGDTLGRWKKMTSLSVLDFCILVDSGGYVKGIVFAAHASKLMKRLCEGTASHLAALAQHRVPTELKKCRCAILLRAAFTFAMAAWNLLLANCGNAVWGVSALMSMTVVLLPVGFALHFPFSTFFPALAN